MSGTIKNLSRFCLSTAADNGEEYDKLPEVARMLLSDIMILPKYEQLSLLEDLKEKRAKGG